MPDYVSTRCTVTGSPLELERFKATCFTGPDRRRFDFETVIPMPEVLRHTDDGSDTELGYEAILEVPYPFDQDEAQNGEPTPAYRWGKFAEQNFQSYADLRDWLAVHDPDVLAAGRNCIRAITETGYPTWYPWTIDHWGTKWNAVSTALQQDSPRRVVFVVRTAWAHPVLVFRQLKAMFPELMFKVACNGHESRAISYPCSRGKPIPGV